ncbi:MAG: hypothetical protein R3191_07260 [Anaerolineales bacterium]|nr:hypothetical protein [Anaerolineales bacterium]
MTYWIAPIKAASRTAHGEGVAETLAMARESIPPQIIVLEIEVDSAPVSSNLNGFVFRALEPAVDSIERMVKAGLPEETRRRREGPLN